jgi:cytochrome c oxidase subunit 2
MSKSKDIPGTISYILFIVTAVICVVFAITAFYFVFPNRETWMVGLPQASSYAGDIDGLFGLITYLVGFWFVVSEVVFFYFIFRYRRKIPDQKAEYVTGEEHHQKQWVTIPHILVIICDVALIFGTVYVWYKVKQDLPPAQATIRVTGQQWAWTFQHPGPDGQLDKGDDDIYLVDELHLKVDTVYHFKLESTDVLHSFSIPAFRIKQDSVPGRTITGWFEPTLVGEYDIQCAEMCGIGHGLMKGRVYVHAENEYSQWLKGENLNGATAAETSAVALGQVALERTSP